MIKSVLFQKSSFNLFLIFKFWWLSNFKWTWKARRPISDRFGVEWLTFVLWLTVYSFNFTKKYYFFIFMNFYCFWEWKVWTETTKGIQTHNHRPNVSLYQDISGLVRTSLNRRTRVSSWTSTVISQQVSKTLVWFMGMTGRSGPHVMSLLTWPAHFFRNSEWSKRDFWTAVYLIYFVILICSLLYLKWDESVSQK